MIGSSDVKARADGSTPSSDAVHPAINVFPEGYVSENGCYEVVLGHTNFRGLYGDIYMEDPDAPLFGPKSIWVKRNAHRVGMHGEFKGPAMDKQYRVTAIGTVNPHNVSHHIVKVWVEVDDTLTPYLAGTPVKVIKGLVRACGTHGFELTKAIDLGHPIHFSVYALCSAMDKMTKVYTLKDVVTWDLDSQAAVQARIATLTAASKAQVAAKGHA
jgi:hypothetical protein